MWSSLPPPSACRPRETVATGQVRAHRRSRVPRGVARLALGTARDDAPASLAAQDHGGDRARRLRRMPRTVAVVRDGGVVTRLLEGG